METNVFDFASALILCIFGTKFLKKPNLQTAYIRLLLVEVCLFIEIVTLGSSYGDTLLADDMCKAMFSFSILSFVVILTTICVYGCIVFEHPEHPVAEPKHPEAEHIQRNNNTHQEDSDTLLLAKNISVMSKLLGFVSGFFMFLYCYRLFDRYYADELLIVFTSIDFSLDFLEIIYLILITSDILPSDTPNEGRVGHHDGN